VTNLNVDLYYIPIIWWQWEPA